MSVRITTLIENSMGTNLSLHSEHGLSFLIENDGVNVLFDTGQSHYFLENAFNLGIDLSKVKHVVLSHNHYDHAGGLKHFIRSFHNDFKLYLGQDFFEQKYSCEGIRNQYLGGNFNEAYLKEKNVATKYIDSQVTNVEKDIYVVTQFERIEEDNISSKFCLRKDNTFKKDGFNDEVCIVIETKKGLVILLGCSHPGVVNILRTVEKCFNQHIYCVLGGTHLVDADDGQLDQVTNYFIHSGIDSIGVSHCTGESASEYLKLHLKDKFFRNTTGTSIEI